MQCSWGGIIGNAKSHRINDKTIYELPDRPIMAVFITKKVSEMLRVVVIICLSFLPYYAIATDVDQKRRCFSEAVVSAFDVYFNTEYKTLMSKVANIYSDDRESQRMRNVCLGAMESVILNCRFYECLESVGLAKDFNAFFMARIPGNKICEYRHNIDCVKDNDKRIIDFLRTTDTTIGSMFVYDMDSIIAEILQNNEDKVFSKLDINPPICYARDSNKDTIWHAFVRINSSEWYKFANLCASLLDTEQEEDLFRAALYYRNKNGETAVTEAARLGRLPMVFDFFRDYIKQEKINCTNLLELIAEKSRLDIKEISGLCK